MSENKKKRVGKGIVLKVCFTNDSLSDALRDAIKQFVKANFDFVSQMNFKEIGVVENDTWEDK